MGPWLCIEVPALSCAEQAEALSHALLNLTSAAAHLASCVFIFHRGPLFRRTSLCPTPADVNIAIWARALYSVSSLQLLKAHDPCGSIFGVPYLHERYIGPKTERACRWIAAPPNATHTSSPGKNIPVKIKHRKGPVSKQSGLADIKIRKHPRSAITLSLIHI